MIFEFEQLEPAEVRPEEHLQDKEAWYPKWQCFCCQDTGKVQMHLVLYVIPAYNYRDRLPICQNCNKGHLWFHLKEFGVIDLRLSVQVCRKLHELSRKDWQQSIEKQVDQAQQIENVTSQIAQNQSLRKRARTQEESIIAAERHSKAWGDWEEVSEEKEIS